MSATLPSMSWMKLATKNVVTVYPDEPVSSAARLMRKEHVGDVVVVRREGRKHKPVGILTDRDVVMETVAEDVEAGGLLVGDIMTRNVLTVSTGDSLEDVIATFKTSGVRRLPVVNPDRTLAGIVTVDDVVGYIVEELALLKKLPKIQKKVEAVRRKPR